MASFPASFRDQNRLAKTVGDETSQFVTLVIDDLFASQLSRIFGPVGGAIDGIGGSTGPLLGEAQRSVILPLDVCRQIHDCWQATIREQLKYEEQMLDSFIFRDEELAQLLQAEENEWARQHQGYQSAGNLTCTDDEVTEDFIFVKQTALEMREKQSGYSNNAKKFHPVVTEKYVLIEEEVASLDYDDDSIFDDEFEGLDAAIKESLEEEELMKRSLQLQLLYEQLPFVSPEILLEKFFQNDFNCDVTVTLVLQEQMEADEALARGLQEQEIQHIKQGSLKGITAQNGKGSIPVPGAVESLHYPEPCSISPSSGGHIFPARTSHSSVVQRINQAMTTIKGTTGAIPKTPKGAANMPKQMKALSEKVGNGESKNSARCEVVRGCSKRTRLPYEPYEVEDDALIPDDPWMYRDEAKLHQNMYQLYSKKAKEAAQANVAASAAHFAQIAKMHMTKWQEADERARKAIMTTVNAKHQDANVLDLHHLQVKEAIIASERFLNERQNLLDTSNLHFLKVSIITGWGRHSATGKGAIKPAIKNFLRTNNYKFAESNRGTWEVALSRQY